MKKNNEPTLFQSLKKVGRPTIPLAKRRSIAHRPRPYLAKGNPVHVTIKLLPFVSTLRSKRVMQIFKNAVMRARLQKLRIIHFSLQHDHIHLLIEAESNHVLSKGIQAFCISFAKKLIHCFGLNKEANKKGIGRIKIFKDRYHLHILNSIQEIKNAIFYIVNNGKKHKAIKNQKMGDLYSSGILICYGVESFLSYFNHIFEFDRYHDNILEIVSEPNFWKIKKAYELAA